MFNDEDLEELQRVMYWAICEGYIVDEMNPNLKSIIDKLNFSKDDLKEMEDISGKKMV